MCKQFESEVPVRCHLLLDLSPAVRLGYPGPNSANRLVSLAATVADVLASNRDPVGLALIDGTSVRIEKPSASRKSVLRMIDALATAMDRPMAPVSAPAAPFLRSALDVARVRNPELLARCGQGFRGLLPMSKRKQRSVQLAAFLSAYYELEPMQMATMIEMDAELSWWLQRFLADHRIPYAGSRFDARGRDLFESASKVTQMTKLLERAVLHGRDNELFVLMADLCDADYDLDPLLRSIKVARARHHRVMLLSAWAPNASGPDSFPDLSDSPTFPAPRTFAWHQRRAAFQRLRTELGRLRVPVVPATDRMADKLILNQLELIRAGRVAS